MLNQYHVASTRWLALLVVLLAHFSCSADRLLPSHVRPPETSGPLTAAANGERQSTSPLRDNDLISDALQRILLTRSGTSTPPTDNELEREELESLRFLSAPPHPHSPTNPPLQAIEEDRRLYQKYDEALQAFGRASPEEAAAIKEQILGPEASAPP